MKKPTSQEGSSFWHARSGGLDHVHKYKSIQSSSINGIILEICPPRGRPVLSVWIDVGTKGKRGLTLYYFNAASSHTTVQLNAHPYLTQLINNPPEATMTEKTSTRPLCRRDRDGTYYYQQRSAAKYLGNNNDPRISILPHTKLGHGTKEISEPCRY